MLFVLKNASVTFQKAIDVIHAATKWQRALVFIDKIIILSKEPKEHVGRISEVLELRNSAGMTMKLKNPYSLVKLLTTWAILTLPANNLSQLKLQKL